MVKILFVTYQEGKKAMNIKFHQIENKQIYITITVQEPKVLILIYLIDIKNFILYIVYVLALAYLDKTNIDRENYPYLLIILGIPFITVHYISDTIIDKIENAWIK